MTTEVSGYEVLGRISSVVVYIGLAVFAVCLRGFVLQSLWGWFLTPVVALPAPGLAVCTVKKRQDNHGPWKTLGISVLEAGVVLLFGWLIHLFV